LTFASGLSISPASPADNTLLISEGNRFALRARRLAIDGEVDETRPFLNIDPNGTIAEPNFILTKEDNAYRQPNGIAAVPSTPTEVATADPTSEVGIASVFEFEIRISNVFQNANYSGNLTIGISNG
jgi:hypothetical protein